MNELRLYIQEVGVAELAARIGCSKSLIYHVLNGRRAPSKDFARKVEEASGGFVKKERLLWSDAA